MQDGPNTAKIRLRYAAGGISGAAGRNGPTAVPMLPGGRLVGAMRACVPTGATGAGARAAEAAGTGWTPTGAAGRWKAGRS